MLSPKLMGELSPIVQRNKDPKSGVVQFRIGDHRKIKPNAVLAQTLTEFWLAHDGLSHSEVPPQLAGRCSLQQWQTLIAEVDNAAASRCHSFWCFITPLNPFGLFYCWLATNRAKRGFHAAADKFELETGLHVSIFKFESFVCEPDVGPRPHLLEEEWIRDTVPNKGEYRGMWVFQIGCGS